ncbi:MAG: NADH-quinone oxidoreductase subunit NuoG, partial [Candidatus Tumulicola sp.]
DPDAVRFRASIIEGMMENHPHDCPVCDEGGVCHLQDMTVMTGHDYRRYRFPKRTFRNQNLGPFLNHEMNRCIQCYRCVRFYREYAGGTDLDVFKLRDVVYFGRAQDGVLENEFAGGLVEICPTGVFTDKTFKLHYTREWDLTMAPSICVHCSMGCNTTPGARYGMLRRIVNRYSGEVNGYFLCDRGRYGYEFVNDARRVRASVVRVEGQPHEVGHDEALEHARRLMAESRTVIGIGSPRASLESNFALRALVGPDNFHLGMSDHEGALVTQMLDSLRAGPARTPSMREAEQFDAVFIVGEDVPNTAPRLALSLRQSARQQPLEQLKKLGIPIWQDHAAREAAQHERGPFFIASLDATRLDDVATATYRAAPVDIARFGFAVARYVSGDAAGAATLAGGADAAARQCATALAQARRPLIVSGAGCRDSDVIRAAAAVAEALCRAGSPAGLIFAMPESNSLGAALVGGQPLGTAFAVAATRPPDLVIVLENDLYRRAPAAAVNAFLSSAKHLIALDSLNNATTDRAELVLPAGSFAEAQGTLVNNEGRAQRSFPPILPDDDVQDAWRWLTDIRQGAHPDDAPWQSFDDIVRAMGAAIPSLAGAVDAAPLSDFRMAGAKVPREPQRHSGRTSILANVDVSEPKPPDDLDAPLSFTMEGAITQPPASLVPFVWSPGWNSIQSTNLYQREIAGPMKGGDAGVRLIEPAAATGATPAAAMPEAFQQRQGEWLVAPLHHVFGSEELSNAAPGVASLAPAPYVALNDADALALDAQPGDVIELTLDGETHRLPLLRASALPPGVAGLPIGLPALPAVTLPAWSRLVHRQ